MNTNLATMKNTAHPKQGQGWALIVFLSENCWGNKNTVPKRLLVLCTSPLLVFLIVRQIQSNPSASN